MSEKNRQKKENEEALGIIEKNQRKGIPPEKIVDLLNDRGLRTLTGEKWTYSVCCAEIEKHHFKVEIVDSQTKPTKGNKKKLFKDQFERALEFIAGCMEKGFLKKEIVVGLNEAGYMTRTGKKWTASTLTAELKKLRES